jgi:Domain found in Dishevelled, Egl-10, and Pleckstrin (DEP)
MIRQSGSFSEHSFNAVILRDALLGVGGVEIRDRTYRLKAYAQCFVGREAIDWLCKEHGLSRSRAVRMGELFVAKGWIEHVSQEHDFEDAFLFYRVAHGVDAQARFGDQQTMLAVNQISLTELTQRMRQQGGLRQRDCYRWLLRIPNSFSGKDVADWIAATYTLGRDDAVLLAQRLVASNKIRHVLDEQGFIDGAVFYRYV